MNFLRYPGGKGRLISFLADYLPSSNDIGGCYFEPFLGGGSVFLTIKPDKSIVSDINNDLIELYRGIRNYPHKVWQIFTSFPSGKKAYFKIRDSYYRSEPLYYRAARTLYLNRTCFKGMWRHDSKGNFNIGYGGERRGAISNERVIELSKIFRKAKFLACDFEQILDNVNDGDYIFLDPPYKPGSKELKESHYAYSRFTFEDQERLARKLIEISTNKDVKWLMTNSAHNDIKKLYRDFYIARVPNGTSDRIGIYTNEPKEILISNYLGGV